MLQSLLSQLYISIHGIAGLFPHVFHLPYVVTHTLSFEDAVSTPKFVGVFKKRRKVSTLFRRA